MDEERANEFTGAAAPGEKADNFKELAAMLEKKEYRAFKEELAGMNTADAADFLSGLPSVRLPLVFRTLPKELAAELFSYLPQETQEELIIGITEKEASEIIDELYVDDAVDVLDELPANMVKKILRHTSPDTRMLINQFLRYPEDSAGSIMTAEFVDLRQEMTVAQAFGRIRKIGIDSETVYTCYVTDENRRLEGVTTVKRLFLSDMDCLIKDIMDTGVISAYTTDDQEDVARTVSKYDFIALPVVDQENRLVGVITVDDIVDVISEEATEDIEKMAAMLPSQQPYLKTGVMELAKNRIVWLLALMISAMLTGHILDRYENAFVTMPILVIFIPMLMDTGGNAGSQSAVLIIRGMALSEIKLSDAGVVLWKEIRVSLIVGVILALVNFARLMFMYPGQIMMAVVVGMSLMATVTLAKVTGSLMPMLAQLLRVDPAIMASPLITTLVDAISILLYLNIARIFFNI